ncbi:MAG: hypothetical protein [Bacteriophage sp.]|jgi:hypothetical protein|uniref:hypothetical protein n=1 Tax=Phocaeicola plebeius TaxID=310297 RepID=UPI002209BB67|nr:hypothetical protein [Phocaeicola plebeius]UVM80555.1 MAG: hypothetical protein [Bacteriophage sp.]
MSRLIDADELIKYIKIWEIGTSISSDQKEFIDCVNQQPTAFDIDDVVAQLKQLKRDIRYDIAYEIVRNVLDKIIEIVEGGGVE